ncbi:MG2 domain-containing protein [Solitalea sp. MAHUQ-68]|uniref:MG2 domain-containing protein n=1 Tax=Solitalea agri TaxID=2953739 RepID=A0A9X2F8P2_9SPHI|nr:MG2 domain-containing protein [Solitalea agri]MCO4293778.1 MG2 domain-containing protein [Solitalea agri]
MFTSLKIHLTTRKALFTSLIVITLTALTLTFCKKNALEEPDAAYNEFIEAYTSGIVSKQSNVRIQLAAQTETVHEADEPLEDGLFSINPSVKGKAFWTDARTIEFRPEEDMKPDQVYQVSFKLGKVTKVPQQYTDFKFGFSTIKPSIGIDYDGFHSLDNSLEQMSFSGIVYTADAEDPEKVEQMISVDLAGNGRTVKWTHENALRTHRFTIDSLQKTNTPQTLEVQTTGKPLGLNDRMAYKAVLPALGDFTVLSIRAVNDAEQYVLVQFSEPVAINQDLEGLITLSEVSDLRYTISGSEVKVFAPEKLNESYSVRVAEGIKNIADKALPRPMAANVFFENSFPSVEIPGKGVIIPSGGKLVMPFYASNLKAVDVTIIKIYENNVSQYLQQNDLNGEYDLRRVAKPVVQKTIYLDTDKGLRLNKKNRFALDLDKLIRTEPGAIYRITIGFRREYSLFNCEQDSTENIEEEREYYGDKIDEDDDFWRRYDSYYPYGYHWDERQDPCKLSYYNKERWAVRNVIASNMGIIAKRGNDNSMLVAITDLLTTKPIENAEVQLLDYQRQVLGKAKTDGDGLATLNLPKQPFLLVAKKGEERGYLKLDDGSSLPVSKFNLGGDEVQKGIKGFIYGERGVWRPGDSIFVSFILEDKENKLPQGHPVSFELYNPKGQLYKKVVQTKSINGFYTFPTATEVSSPTGNWLAKVKVGGATFQKVLRIETIMPNRLKINLDFGKKELVRGENPSAVLNAKWLFGGVAHNLKAKVDVSLSAASTSFKGLSDYNFQDPVSSFATENKTVFDGQLDENGNATVKANISVDKTAPGMLNANFLIKVFEPGGNFSIDNFTLPYHVFKSYVGIKTPEGDEYSGMLPTGKNIPVDIANVTTTGALLGGQRQVEVELFKIQWKWWWDESDDDFSNFTQDQYNKFISREVVSLQNGKGQWSLKVSDDDWGRYLVRIRDLKSGHVTGKVLYLDNPYWSSRSDGNGSTAATMLTFTSDKEKYNVGDEVKLTIPSAQGGRALVSIESGSKVVKTYWVEATKGETQFKFKAESSMSPNVFVNVTLLQPHSQTVNDKPIRMYGAIPITIEDKNNILKPILKIPSSIRPESEVSFAVSESSGKEMTYTVALVDEGLLDITRFKTPNPYTAFYAREALGVKTWDLYDYVLGAWGGDLERILSIGGDQSGGKAASANRANRFKPVVKFLGPFVLKANGSNTHKIKLPPYVGSVKVMLIAGQKGAYGFAEQAIAVKKPLMLLTTLPRVLSPGETFKLPVSVFAMERNIRQASVTIQANPFLEVVGANTKSVSFTQPGEQLVYFDVRVKQNLGVAKVKVTAQSGAEKADDNVEIDVRNPNNTITKVQQATLMPGKSVALPVQMIGIAAAAKGTLEVSSIPPINLAKRLTYLIQYPHGCVEQTTSSVFPQLVLNQLMDLSDRQKAEIDRNIKASINRLKGFQTTDGGFGYWPGDSQPDEWGSNYAGHFILEAQKKGYNVPSAMLLQWKKFQKNKAVSWTPSTDNFYGGDLSQAYRLYLLALCKAPEIGAMNRLKGFKYLSNEAKWRLASAYQLAGQEEVAKAMIAGLNTSIKKYKQLGGTFGSDLRDQAMILETLSLLGEQQKAASLVQAVASKLSQDEWYSTQTTAYSLIAIAQYCGENAGSKISYDYQANGAKATVNSNSVVSQVNIAKNGTVAVQNRGSNILYVRLILSGKPQVGDAIEAHENPDVLKLNVAYKTLEGKIIDPSRIEQGTDFVAEVTVTNPGKRGNYEQIALTQLFPSGWQIINTRLTGDENRFNSSPSTYKDIKDDRVNTYFNLYGGRSVTYHVLLNASYIGKFYLPTTNCEAMYDATISAGTNGQWVEVVGAGTPVAKKE